MDQAMDECLFFVKMPDSKNNVHRPAFWCSICLSFYAINLIGLLCLSTLLVSSYNSNIRNTLQSVFNPSTPESTGLSNDEMKIFAQPDKHKSPTAENTHIFTRKKVIIYTTFRSGSSFLGDIFAHQPGVYYMFEPLQTYPPPVTNKNTTYSQRKRRRIAQKGAGFLEQLLDCTYSSFIRDVIGFSSEGYDRVTSWGRRVFCRDYQDGLSFPTSCDPHRTDKLTRTCNDHEIIVIKTIVLHNLTALIPLMAKGIKVIHLVRDPRAQVESIRKLPGGTTKTSSEWAQIRCGDLRRDLTDSHHINTLSKQIRDNYQRVRYEDLSTDPVRVSERLYGFVGIRMHSLVREWLQYATTTRKRSAWSTVRMSNETMSAWRKSIKFHAARWVQAQCGDVMDILGYIPVITVGELHDRGKPLF